MTPPDQQFRDVAVGHPSGRRQHRIDPRIRQRRVDVRREEGRRRLRALVASIVVVAAIAVGVGLTRSPVLDLDYVNVVGAERTPRAALLAATGLDGHPLLVEIDTPTVARRAAALPWVKSARARREWPGTVRIEVTERAPVVVLPVDGGSRWALVDATGRVLSIDRVKPPGWPAIANVARVGPPGTSVAADAAAALSVATALPVVLRPRVTDLAVVSGGEVELHLGPPGGIVRLGPPRQLGPKFAALATLLEKADLTRVAYLDVRVPQAPVLTRR